MGFDSFSIPAEVVRYDGPAFFDMRIRYTLPPAMVGEPAASTGGPAASVERKLHIPIASMTDEQASQILSAGAFCRDLVDHFSETAHPVFNDFIWRPLLALVLAEPDLRDGARMAERRHFETSDGDEPIDVLAANIANPIALRLVALNDLLAANGWTEDTIRVALKGKPRPKF